MNIHDLTALIPASDKRQSPAWEAFVDFLDNSDAGPDNGSLTQAETLALTIPDTSLLQLVVSLLWQAFDAGFSVASDS